MPTVLQRWTFHDPQTDDTYTFAINPNEDGSPQYTKSLGTQKTAAPDGGLLLYEGRDDAQTPQFTGVVLYRLQYDAMIEWFNKRYPIEMTDDLGRVITIYITSFEPKRVRNVSHPWKHTYSVKFVVLGVEMPPVTDAQLAMVE